MGESLEEVEGVGSVAVEAEGAGIEGEQGAVGRAGAVVAGDFKGLRYR